LQYLQAFILKTGFYQIPPDPTATVARVNETVNSFLCSSDATETGHWGHTANKVKGKKARMNELKFWDWDTRQTSCTAIKKLISINLNSGIGIHGKQAVQQ
jgi:hypothetical protein